jgi:hypothetical protein
VVFTVPVPVRYQLAFDAGLTRAVLLVFLRTVFGWQRAAPLGGADRVPFFGIVADALSR